jgi:hypothetical protein
MMLRKLGELDEEDGIALGELLAIKTKGGTSSKVRVGELFSRNEALQEVGKKYAWLQVMLERVLANRLRPPSSVQDKLCNLDVQGGRSIGAALAGSLATNLTACRAVDEWILRCVVSEGADERKASALLTPTFCRYPAMQEMDRLHNAWCVSRRARNIARAARRRGRRQQRASGAAGRMGERANGLFLLYERSGQGGTTARALTAFFSCVRTGEPLARSSRSLVRAARPFEPLARSSVCHSPVRAARPLWLRAPCARFVRAPPSPAHPLSLLHNSSARLGSGP